MNTPKNNTNETQNVLVTFNSERYENALQLLNENKSNNIIVNKGRDKFNIWGELLYGFRKVSKNGSIKVEGLHWKHELLLPFAGQFVGIELPSVRYDLQLKVFYSNFQIKNGLFVLSNDKYTNIYKNISQKP